MTKPTLFLAALAAAVLAGCATPEGTRPKWTLHESDFASITPEKTSKQDVEKQFGKPFDTMVFPNLAEEVWDYRYMSGVQTWVAEVHFDMQGRTKYYTTYPDQCWLGPLGCR
jgi:outer membrane protein assembly factor BamE (lipoprotein component of BamABCDE complex)